MKDTDNIDSEFALLFMDELIQINNNKLEKELKELEKEQIKLDKKNIKDKEYKLEKYEIERLEKILKFFNNKKN